MKPFVNHRLPRGTLFVTLNAALVVFVALFVAMPVAMHFISQSDDIAENAAQLSHYQTLADHAKTLMTNAAQAGAPFLPGREERVVSADLQASLQAVASNAGVRLLGIRGLPGGRSQSLHMVAVSAELEGSLPALRSMMLAVENQTPVLFVSAASLRPVTVGDDNLIRAEIKVQGAMRDARLPGNDEARSP